MVQVKALTNNKKNYKVILTTPNGETFEHQVSQDIVVEYRLIEGKILDDFAFLRFKNDLQKDQWTQKVIAKIQRKPQTEAEVRQYLESHLVSKEDTNAIISKCKRLKLLDDVAFVKHFVDYHLHVKMMGPKRLEFELQNRGIDLPLIQMELTQIPQELYQKHLSHQWEKMHITNQKIPYQKRIEKAKTKWMELGYPYSMITTFLQGCRPSEEDDKTDHHLLLKDAQKIQARLQKDGLTGYELERKLLTKLLAKGYSYSKIKETFQGGFNDES